MFSVSKVTASSSTASCTEGGGGCEGRERQSQCSAPAGLLALAAGAERRQGSRICRERPGRVRACSESGRQGPVRACSEAGRQGPVRACSEAGRQGPVRACSEAEPPGASQSLQ
ncbi:hypothetical protein CYMTET_6447 [Cymbomonas tetramitiformis]|uniref:Uncharacterized protein n=1 Tax=Cymbomonas tetramitiformis TaxID=36881 RepID=A0AAE0GXG6_9CHLO|nr:hypothetical protein CYMTET_6447 [Cymbomonas tetramitiformis]